MQVETPGEREIVTTRDFDAPRELVFDAFTKPEYIRKWLLGPDGWSMPVCDVDLRAGGAFRHVWKNDTTDVSFGVSGIYREIERPARIVHVERFDDDWYGETRVTTEFLERDGGTTVRMHLEFTSSAFRDDAMVSGMTSGIACSYDRLEGQLGVA